MVLHSLPRTFIDFYRGRRKSKVLILGTLAAASKSSAALADYEAAHNAGFTVNPKLWDFNPSDCAVRCPSKNLGVPVVGGVRIGQLYFLKSRS